MSAAGPGVLVVDDEKFFREQIRDALEAASIGCTVASTGEEALELAGAVDIGVIVLDISLPGISGIEVLEQLTRDRPMVKVIIVSAHTEQELVLEALRLGACDYLAKPLHEEELVLAVVRARAGYAVQASGAHLRDRLTRLEGQLAALMQSDLDVDATASGAPGATIEQRASDAIAEILGASKTSLMLLGEDGLELRVAAATGRDLTASEMDPVPIGEGLAGAALVEDQALLVADVASDGRFGNLPHEDRYRSRSVAVAPLRGDSGPVGVLCATDRQEEGPFNDDDLSLLRILSLGVGPALARAGRNASAPGANGQSTGVTESDQPDAELARRICDALTAEIEPSRLIASVLRAVAESVPAAPVSLYLLDPFGNELLLEGQCELASHSDHARLPANQGLTGAVCQTGHLVATDDPEADPRFDLATDTPEGSPARPLLCLPLVLRDKTLGVVRVFPQPGVSASARTGEILIAAISAAVRNVLMYRSLLESVDEVAKARREAQRPS